MSASRKKREPPASNEDTASEGTGSMESDIMMIDAVDTTSNDDACNQAGPGTRASMNIANNDFADNGVADCIAPRKKRGFQGMSDDESDSLSTASYFQPLPSGNLVGGGTKVSFCVCVCVFL